jgi:outer membrane lipoprotein LolB
MTQLKWQLQWLVLALLLSAGLTACVAPTRPVLAEADAQAAQIIRETKLANAPGWSLTGRIALSRGKDGGSGRIDWRQNGEDFEIILAAPITHQSWRIQRKAGLARIDGIEGGSRESDNAEALLLETTGWRIPVNALAKWLRGTRATGASSVAYDGSGLPLRIEQDGWVIEYRAWNAANPPQPTKVFARQGDASVRLVIDQWNAAP